MTGTPIRKRHVFYLSGFDPKGPGFYYDLYRAEAAKQASVSGAAIEVGPAMRDGPLAIFWRVKTQSGDENTDTTYEFTRWDDIIRTCWARDARGLVRDFGRTARAFTATPVLWRVLRTAVPPFIAALYPFFFLTLVLAFAFAAGKIAFLGVHDLAGLPQWTSLAAVPPAALAALWFGLMLEKRMNSLWLMRTYAFAERLGWGIPEMEERLDILAGRIVKRIEAGDVDEILVIGHSAGTIIAVSVMARVLARLKKAPALPVSFLTLGQCIPMLALQPRASRFRDELAAVGNAPEVDWIDFTAPTDGACFAFIDPLAASGIARTDNIPRPKLLSPRFHTLFAPEVYKRIRRDRFRAHFQYLMAGERPGSYDYFAITAGNQSLAARYRDYPSLMSFTRFRMFR